ncbi:MAG: TraB/GumN family protein, partial [bacterium]
EQQLSFLATMGEGQEDELINYTLRDIGELQELLGSIKVAWRSGDLDALDKATLAPLKQEFPELYRVLLVSRNNNWMPLIEEMLKSDPVELVLVGALHLVGQQGLLEQLKDRGYRISRVQ